MYDIERQNKIIEILKEKKSVSVKRLTELLYISPATTRRDLSSLEKRGIIRRTFGGAVLAAESSEETSIFLREQTMVRSKKNIGEKCANYITNGQPIFLDSSSTVTYLVPFLNEFRYLQIITNGLNVGSLLTQTTKFRVLIIGGEIIPRSNSTVGPVATDALDRFHCELGIFSADGIDVQAGVTEASLEQSEVKRKMMANSNFKILLADCTKFGKSFMSKTADISEFDVLITDQKPSQNFIDFCEKSNVKLVY